MPATKNNFTHVTDTELEGVETTMFTVDFINAMTAETGDLSTGSSTAGLEATRAVISQFINILAEGPLVESDKQKTYVVRADSLDTISSTTTVAAIQAAIRALNAMTPDKVTATISSATAADRDLSDTQVA